MNQKQASRPRMTRPTRIERSVAFIAPLRDEVGGLARFLGLLTDGIAFACRSRRRLRGRRRGRRWISRRCQRGDAVEDGARHEHDRPRIALHAGVRPGRLALGRGRVVQADAGDAVDVLERGDESRDGRVRPGASGDRQVGRGARLGVDSPSFAALGRCPGFARLTSPGITRASSRMTRSQSKRLWARLAIVASRWACRLANSAVRGQASAPGPSLVAVDLELRDLGLLLGDARSGS